MDFNIKLAGKVVEIHSMFSSTRDHCCAYLCEEKPDFSITISSKDIELEREKSNLEAQIEDNTDFLCLRR